MASNADQQVIALPQPLPAVPRVVHPVLNPVVPLGLARLYNVNNRSFYTGQGSAVKVEKSNATHNGAKVKTEDRKAKKNKELRRECDDLLEYTHFIHKKSYR